MGLLRVVSVAVPVLAIAVWTVSVKYPESVEDRQIRGFFNGLVQAYFSLFITLERLGITPPTAFVIQGIMNSAGNIVSKLESPSEKVETSKLVIDEVPVIAINPKTNQKRLPAVIYLHGGGFTVCSANTHYKFTESLALETNTIVFSIDYRLAPKHPFPSQLEDSLKVTAAIFKQAESFGVDPANIFIAGDSAGANLATQTALELKGRYQLKGVLLLSPYLQMINLVLPSYQHYTKYFDIKLEWFLTNYAGLKA